MSMTLCNSLKDRYDKHAHTHTHARTRTHAHNAGETAYLIFVGRVEWDLTDFLVLSTELSDVANGQLNTLEQSRL